MKSVVNDSNCLVVNNRKVYKLFFLMKIKKNGITKELFKRNRKGNII